MEDKIIKDLIKSIDVEAEPETEIKDKIFMNIISNSSEINEETLTGLQKIIFLRPVRAAACLAAIVSGILWAVLGNGYINMFAGIFGVR